MNPQEAEIVQPESEQIQALVTLPKSEPLAIARAPAVVLDEARKAAVALRDVIESKPRKVVFNGETYLEFEDWQTLGRFYGISAKEDGDPEFIQLADTWGFKASAVALAGGQVISRATAYCMSDEKNWSNKPKFQLASMAQTRACSKALRNVLSWVVVLAGYRPTPAEEMTPDTLKGKIPQARPSGAPKANVERSKPIPEATLAQKERFMKALLPVKAAALEYAVKNNWILPNTEGLEDIPLSHVPTTQKRFQEIMEGIRVIMDGDQIPGAEAPTPPIEPEFSIEEPAEAWRDLIVPFGKNKGERFGALEKGQLWWWCVKWKPEPWTNEKTGKTYPPKDSDLELRGILDAVREQYQFTDSKQ